MTVRRSWEETPPPSRPMEEPLPEFECPICMELLHNPVRWPAETGGCCEAYLCKACAASCLAHSPRCPMCRAEGAAGPILRADESLSERIRAAHPNLAKARAEREAKLAACESLVLYPMGKFYDLSDRSKIELQLKEPWMVWMAARAIAAGGKFGLLLGPERVGELGRIVTVSHSHKKKSSGSVSLIEACGKVGFQRKTYGAVTLKLHVGPLFRLRRIERNAPSGREAAALLLKHYTSPRASPAGTLEAASVAIGTVSMNPCEDSVWSQQQAAAALAALAADRDGPEPAPRPPPGTSASPLARSRRMVLDASHRFKGIIRRVLTTAA